MRPHMFLVLVAFLAPVLSASPSRAVDVTTCGQTIPSDEVGVLQGDLDCSGAMAGSDGVTLSRGAALDMQGHTLVGPAWDNDAQNGAVRCVFGEVKCRVAEDGRAKCRYPAGTCRVFSSVGTGTITGGAVGVYSQKHLVLENLAVDVTNAAAFATGKLLATNVAITSNGGVYGYDLRLTNVSVSDSLDFGIWALLGGKVRGSNVTIINNLRGGIAAGKVSLVGLTATGNGAPNEFGGVGGGVYAGRVQLVDSSVTGNLRGTGTLDLASGSRPKLLNTTCGTSVNTRAKTPADESWGVCADD